MDLNSKTNPSVNTAIIHDPHGKRPTTSENNTSLVHDTNRNVVTGTSANIAKQFNIQIHELNKTQKKLI